MTSRRLIALAPWLLVLGLAGWLSLGALRTEVGFNADAERDLFEVFAWSHLGRLPAHGVLHASLGLDLGPTYFAILAPINAFWPSPLAVHAVNGVLFVVGLAVFGAGLAAATSSRVALVVAMSYALSEGHVALLGVTYHVGAVSGLALAWLGALLGFATTRRPAWLWVGVGSLGVLVQLHVLAWLYVVPALPVLLGARRDLPARHLVAALAVWLVCLAPMLVYLVRALGDPHITAAGHGGAAGFDLTQALAGTFELAQPHWLLARGVTPVVVAVLAALGLVVGRGAGVSALRLQVALGLLAVATVSAFETSGRYWLGVMPALYALAGVGLHAGARHARHAPAAMLPCLLALAPLAPPPGWLAARPPDGVALGALEQEAVVERLVSQHGVFGGAFITRVHGALLGPFSGVRYLERIARADRAPTSAPGDWRVSAGDAGEGRGSGPERRGNGEADLSARRLADETLSPAGRPLRLERFTPTVDKARITADGHACGHVLPFMWSQQSTELLVAVGFPGGHGPDVHRCLAYGRGLSIPVGPLATEVTIELTDDAHFRGETSAVAIALDGQPLEENVQTGEDRTRRVVSLPPGAAQRQLLVRPAADRVVFLDVY